MALVGKHAPDFDVKAVINGNYLQDMTNIKSPVTALININHRRQNGCIL